MKTVESLVPAVYSTIERGSASDADELIERLVGLEIPAFVIAKAGSTIAEATKRTRVASLLRAQGYGGDIRNRVDFGTVARSILPQDFTGMAIPTGDEWAETGVTPLHSDLSTGERGQQYSLNLTLLGGVKLGSMKTEYQKSALMNNGTFWIHKWATCYGMAWRIQS